MRTLDYPNYGRHGRVRRVRGYFQPVRLFQKGRYIGTQHRVLIEVRLP